LASHVGSTSLRRLFWLLVAGGVTILAAKHLPSRNLMNLNTRLKVPLPISRSLK
jgi:hypothetical protein